MRRILLATTNEGKVREASAILGGLAIELITPAGRDWPVPEETGATFEENARLKALHYARCAHCWALADDSGLVVDALGGAPGVLSARFAGAAPTVAANNARLIRELAGVARDDRTARFCCAVALADETKVLVVAEGSWEGLVIDEARGENGFGYDPHFLVPSESMTGADGMTAAEMSSERKNALSHRGQAFRALRRKLELLL